MLMTERGRAMWRTCLASAFRTALACTIVGSATLYGPEWINRHVAFPAFSYVTVILIITDATLGDTLRGCWLALYATCQSVGPAIVTLKLIRPARLTAETTALAAALAAFVVVLPNSSTHLVAKRIALGQIVLIYVIGYIKGAKTDPVMHPLQVAASTALGVVACVLALLVPLPRLATCEVKQSCKELGQNVTTRVKLYMKAFCSDDSMSATASVSQARVLARSSSKLYQTLKRYQPSMTWERLPFKIWRWQNVNDNKGEKLQSMEIALRGMEMVVASKSPIPSSLLAGEVKEDLKNIQERVILSIKRVNNSSQPSVTPESDPKNPDECLQTLQEIPGTPQDLPFYFFLFCIRLLETIIIAKPEENKVKVLENKFKTRSWISDWDSKKIMPALKLSLSLGLAILLGSMFSKPNGYWAGLPVAVSFAAAREATFKVTNVKAQGTVIGTVYGVMGCFVFQKFLTVRFLSLLPWFLFSSFLSRSKMYGQAGGISAAIGAVLILGRKNFGPPSEFAIERIIETFIGLSCSIMVELVFQPTRAANIAKLELSRSFHALYECASLFGAKASKADIMESQKKLRSHLNELKKFTAEAHAEPSFWFSPFNFSCYEKLFKSLSKMADLLQFSGYAIGFLGEQGKTKSPQCKEILSNVDKDLKSLTESIGLLAKSFEEITLLKSLDALEKALAKSDNTSWDIELGKTPNPSFSTAVSEPEKILETYLQHCRSVADGLFRVEEDGEEEVEVDKSEVVLSLCALGFCVERIGKETREIEEMVKEVVQSENPSSHVNLHEISCKIRSLYK
ncbi:hypothetical protein AtNW77_Chr2g0248401 [Arabidopsis thaliana]|uniref:p-hydroxybenzoic acid efflux pump subunit n=4 Tax=Arabidopsis TaxID=3701 RepID=Q84W96_ARATH|nr:P-hydroxybenzoic acid efflux pump subunit [Arabidopsis thaliana]KAG7637804.1 hypothetical protein ISN45_At02g022950 [Arabidopsis thaliana x Arabidopsis arenosa]AAO42117.1 unknown protein [Arabidopsis thaliana]AAP40430.1 unknown protein [Arabidopsis thaliana]AEC08170.1 P-hydroxybenzoic acid efflux pump subunit [Arabidopsis thaliana]OAP08603.1 hypothetical protein AXX17_AT2G24880 [Arabidopsis thaliana]|eukprot:NP_180444.2 P-hydroxybenzoic acid efflux pump subunit [Arabidopsis thaliana]